MPTIVTKTERPRPHMHIGPVVGALWDRYREHRGNGVSETEAARRVLDAHQIDNARQRHMLTTQLVECEREHGLAKSQAQIDAERDAARAALAAGPEPPDRDADLSAIERDAKARVRELEDQRRRLAPESLTDAAVSQELANIESELAEAERALQRVPLAREERGRRERQAVEDAEREEREAAMKRARALVGDRAKALGRLAKAEAAYAKAIADFHGICRQQANALAAAGSGPQNIDLARPSGPRLIRSLRRALHDHGERAPEALGRFETTDRRLGETEPTGLV